MLDLAAGNTQNSVMEFEYSVLEDAAAVVREAAEDFRIRFLESVKNRGSFNVLLSGGKTPKALFFLLAKREFRDLPWSEARFFWGDERCVAADHSESNYRAARELLLAKVPIVGDRVYPAVAATGDPVTEAARYEKILRDAFKTKEGEFPVFDYALMGLGPDGHTASLFPGGDAVREREKWVVAAYNESHAVRSRLTLTVPVFNSARHVVFLITGESKKAAAGKMLEAVNRGRPADPLPAALIRPKNGRLVYFLDRAADSANNP